MFKAHVVKHDNSKAENFIPVDSISSDLFKQKTWKRNNIVEVHVVAPTIGFVATDAAALERNMKKIPDHVGKPLPRGLIENRGAAGQAGAGLPTDISHRRHESTASADQPPPADAADQVAATDQAAGGGTGATAEQRAAADKAIADARALAGDLGAEDTIMQLQAQCLELMKENSETALEVARRYLGEVMELRAAWKRAKEPRKPHILDGGNGLYAKGGGGLYGKRPGA